MKVLLIAEHDNKKLKSATRHVASAALQFGDSYEVLIIGHQCGSVLNEVKKLSNVQKILLADASSYEHQLAENSADLIASLAANYDVILTSAGTFGKNILPRVAALLDVAMIGDVIKIISKDTFVRPIYAGNALQTVQSLDKIKILSVRTTAFPEVKLNDSATVTVESLSKNDKNTLAEFVREDLTVSKRPELTNARIVVSGGRGLKSAENFKLLENLADRLGAALGASRAAVDAGFAPNDYQVGQTGKVVAPELYIAIGISGAIQHIAGMKDSKVIVAINNDPEAPIFQVADYGLVADLFGALRELESHLSLLSLQDPP